MNAARRKTIEENKTRLEKLWDELDEIKGNIETAKDEEREYYDNMPEGLQAGDKGTTADEHATALETASSALDEAATQIADALSELENIQ